MTMTYLGPEMIDILSLEIPETQTLYQSFPLPVHPSYPNHCRSQQRHHPNGETGY